LNSRLRFPLSLALTNSSLDFSRSKWRPCGPDTSAARFRCLRKPKGVQKFPQPRILAANTTGGADAPTELECNGGVWPRTSASDLIGPIRFIGLRHLKVAPGPALIAQLQPASPKKLHLVVNTTINFKTRQKLILIISGPPRTR
jgi:hypothetical protein